MTYGISKTVAVSFDTAVLKVTEELKKEGFGILTTIDVKQTLRTKIDVDVPRYIILGACNPSFAHKALQVEEQIGLLLPCNVIVYEKGNETIVSAFDPLVMGNVSDNPALKPIADEVRERLVRVIENC
jgi:uncharacterized protein (DUF302 family)